VALLELKNIHRRFGGVAALQGASLCIEPGEVHLLMGENGAGKSTLMKITAGMQSFEEGEMLWRGQPLRFRSPAMAAQAGIAMVHQESLLAPHLSVAENIFLGHELTTGFGLLQRSRMSAEARRLIAENGFTLDADAQLVEICRALQRGASLIIFDEPTSSLSERETKEVFRIVRGLRERGSGVIYITHRLEELRDIGDRVTVLRDGRTVHTAALASLSRDELVRHMVGREVNALYQRKPNVPGEEMLRAKGISAAPPVHKVSFSVRAGEIVGLAGLMGAGRTEVCRAVFGLDPLRAGELYVAGKRVQPRSPREAVRHGIALIPEDRQRSGLATALPVGWNLSLASLDLVSSPLGVLSAEKQSAMESNSIQRLSIKTASPALRAGRLSGGNQQKIVIAKWMARGARIFLFDEPTRGIDIGAKMEVFAALDELARQGAAVLMVSSELPELLQMADRILVMRNGQIAGELATPTTQEQIMHLAAFAGTSAANGAPAA
jgi:ribose transport system ATP-binding protein